MVLFHTVSVLICWDLFSNILIHFGTILLSPFVLLILCKENSIFLLLCMDDFTACTFQVFDISSNRTGYFALQVSLMTVYLEGGGRFSEGRTSIDSDVIFFVMFDFGEEYVSCIVYPVDIQEDKLIKTFSQLSPYRCG